MDHSNLRNVLARVPEMETKFGHIDEAEIHHARDDFVISVQEYQRYCSQSPSAREIQSLVKRVEASFTAAENLLKNLGGDSVPEKEAISANRSLAQHLKAVYERIPHRHTNVAERISRIAGLNPDDSFLSGVLIQATQSMDLPPSHISNYNMYLLGKIQSISDFPKLLSGSSEEIGELASKIARSRDEFESMRQTQSRYLDDIKRVKGQIDGAREQLELLQDASVQAISNAEKASSDVKISIEKAIEQVKEKVRLQEPLHYWRRRTIYFAVFSGLMTVVFILSVGFVLDEMLDVIAVITSPSSPNKTVLGQNVVAALYDLTIWERIGVLALPSALVIWILRLIARGMISKSHLREDAGHRHVLLKTYLALLSDEKNPMTPEDRMVVLSVLFKGIEDGLVRTDPNPILWRRDDID